MKFAFHSLVCLLLCGCAAPKLTHGIPNFGQVSKGLYRGGQPTPRGWAYLKSVGVTNVVKLNTESEGSDAVAERMGMNVWRAPISLGQQTIGEPGSNQLWRAVERLQVPGTFVHCSHGQDRTGLVVAFYRVNCDGWTKPQAESEMMARGFHPWLRGLYWAWQDYSYVSK